MTRVRRAWAWIEPRMVTRGGTGAVAVLALTVLALSSIVWPVMEGRDSVTHLRVYADMWSVHSVIPWEIVLGLALALLAVHALGGRPDPFYALSVLPALPVAAVSALAAPRGRADDALA